MTVLQTTPVKTDTAPTPKKRLRMPTRSASRPPISGPQSAPAARALCSIASERPILASGVRAETSASAAGKTPLTAPCTPRQSNSVKGVVENPIPNVASAMPNTERTTIGL